MWQEQPLATFGLYTSQPRSVQAGSAPVQLQLPPDHPPQPPNTDTRIHRPALSSLHALAKRRNPNSTAGRAELYVNQLARYVHSSRGRVVGAVSTAIGGAYAVSGYVVLLGPASGAASVPQLLVFGISGCVFGVGVLVFLYWLDDANMLHLPGLPMKDSNTAQHWPRQRQQQALLRSMRGFAAATGRAFRRASPAEVRLLVEMVREHGRPVVANLT
jgi:hypothetical protein